jgi:hypothetical protein
MDKTYPPYDPEQLLLLRQSLRDWLPEDHLVHFLSDLVDQLDLSAITSPYEQEARGYPPCHPRMMVKLLLYAYTLGIPPLPQDRPALSGGRRLPGTHREQHPGLPGHSDVEERVIYFVPVKSYCSAKRGELPGQLPFAERSKSSSGRGGPEDPPAAVKPQESFRPPSSAHFSSMAVVTDLGRSMAYPRARSQVVLAMQPTARPMPKRTV